MENVKHIEVLEADIAGSGAGNSDDPLARALARVNGGEWWTEVFASGKRMKTGQAWRRDRTASQYFDIDEQTTKALQDLDSGTPFTPRTAILREQK